MKTPFLLCLLITFCGLSPVVAQQDATGEPVAPWWEIGAGLALVNIPHYPGASQSSLLAAPFPYPVYHSERINLDEEGLVASLAETGRFSLKVSLNGSLPVSDSDNDARVGMEDLDLMVETGPSLHISLRQWESAELRFELPIRAAFRVSDSLTPVYTGWTSNPGLYYETDVGAWQWESSIGAIWSSSTYHAFFYDVDAEYVTATRSQYQSEGGFTGWRSSLTLKRRWGDFIGIGYVRYMNFSGAANASSPLLIESNYLAGGLSLIYMLYSSK